MISKENISKAERVANKARKSLSSLCFEECKAYCCRKGFLIISEKQINILLGDKMKDFEAKGNIKMLDNGNYSLNLDNHLGSCPCLVEFKCKIHKNPDRPQACKDFPVFINGDTVRLSPRCPGVKIGKLYPYEHMFLKLGFTLGKSHAYSDMELYKVKFNKN
jgi:Fe-S-cluster containining protein